MLFPKLEEVTGVWKKVVEGVINNRLGPTAKVAPDEGKPDDRLICVYTKVCRSSQLITVPAYADRMVGLQGRRGCAACSPRTGNNGSSDFWSIHILQVRCIHLPRSLQADSLGVWITGEPLHQLQDDGCGEDLQGELVQGKETVASEQLLLVLLRTIGEHPYHGG